MLTSVIVATRNRPNKIYACLKSILANNFSNYELIVVDQSDNEESKARIGRFGLKVRYFKIRSKGLSRARNFGVGKSRGEIIAFTDDDCLVDKNWLKNIATSLRRNNLSGVLGAILPYRPKEHRGLECPCTLVPGKPKVFNSPIEHWKVGFGGNSAYRREVFKKYGLFEENLGRGSIGESAEDAELELRLLSYGINLFYNPKMIVCHNRWVTKTEHDRQRLYYSCGEVASYGYLSFRGLTLGRKVVKNNFESSYCKLKQGIKFVLKGKSGMGPVKEATIEFYYKTKGLLVALIIFLLDFSKPRRRFWS